jgi:hypothetical protein
LCINAFKFPFVAAYSKDPYTPKNELYISQLAAAYSKDELACPDAAAAVAI